MTVSGFVVYTTKNPAKNGQIYLPQKWYLDKKVKHVVPAWHRACSVANRHHNLPRASLAHQSFGPPRKSARGNNSRGRPEKLMAGTQTREVFLKMILYKFSCSKGGDVVMFRFHVGFLGVEVHHKTCHLSTSHSS